MLVAKQGEGSYATVWKARDKRSGQIVAIKELKEPYERCVGSLERVIEAFARSVGLRTAPSPLVPITQLGGLS